jgi:hypothetical protein
MNSEPANAYHVSSGVGISLRRIKGMLRTLSLASVTRACHNSTKKKRERIFITNPLLPGSFFIK